MSKDQNADLDSLLLHGVERDVLNTVRLYLDVPFSIQELLAAQHTPTLSHMFPAYKELLDLFKLLRSKAPLLSHAIDASIRKLEDYLDSMRGHRIATLAMRKSIYHSYWPLLSLKYCLITVVNPTMKLQRLHDLGWSSSEIEQARDWLRDEVGFIKFASQYFAHQRGATYRCLPIGRLNGHAKVSQSLGRTGVANLPVRLSHWVAVGVIA